ncbi:MAG: beta-ketoacyl-ACP synthase II [Deltaproteobacteria bacterium]|nr:MAG: beta-ketoacyl-ACP synthase II [Deltaproteobacteria bacterium]
MARRVVITGLGMVTPLSIGVEENWEAVSKGKSGIGPITKFDASSFPCQIAGEVRDFRSEDFLSAKDAKHLDIFIHYAIASARMAVEDSRLKITPKNNQRVGCVTGSGIGGLSTIEFYHKALLEKGPRRVSPFFIPGIITNMAPGQIAIEFGARGPNTCVVTACAASAHAIGDSFKIIQRGAAEAMISGGTEAVITPLALGGFTSMKSLSTRNDEPERASRPFDIERDGFIMSEGGGIIILEELNHALDRGADIYAEMVGYGMSSDAYHFTAPDPDGIGASLCMEAALKDAGLNPTDIDYINAHGTSTKLNDISETKAIKSVFGDHAYKIAISSTKSMTGHLLGGAGVVESIYSILTIRNGLIPPTINYEFPDPECDLDYVPNEARMAKVRSVLSNSFGFGGTNSSLIFKEFVT